jgi:hypothetical protein
LADNEKCGNIIVNEKIFSDLAALSLSVTNVVYERSILSHKPKGE